MLASSSSSSSEMRPGFILNEPNPQAPMATVEAVPPTIHTAWHSPVPYLFGGLAAMLGLITFALLILVCSYWKLSGYVERTDSGEHMSETANSGERGTAMDESQEKPTTVLEERFVVIMAGDEKKMFLANPIRSRAYSLTGGGGDEESSGGAMMVKRDGAVCVCGG